MIPNTHDQFERERITHSTIVFCLTCPPSHPDINVGLTISAYRYEGMRSSDVRRVVSALQRQLRNQVGPFSQRPASKLFESWCEKGKVFAEMIHQKKLADEEAEMRAAQQKLAHDESKMDESAPAAVSSSSSSSTLPKRRKLKLTPIVPLAIFQLSDKLQMKALYQRVRYLPESVDR